MPKSTGGCKERVSKSDGCVEILQTNVKALYVVQASTPQGRLSQGVTVDSERTEVT